MATRQRVVPIANLPLFHLAVPRQGESEEEAIILPHRDDAPLGYGSRIAYLFPNETYARPAQIGSIYSVPDDSGATRVLLRRNAQQFVPSRVRRLRDVRQEPMHRYRGHHLLISARYPPATVEALRTTHLITSAHFFHLRRKFRVPHMHAPHITEWVQGREPKWLPTRSRPLQPTPVPGPSSVGLD